MKKTFRKVALYVCAFVMSLGMTSCDGTNINIDDIVSLINLVMESTGTQGKTYNFAGTAKGRLLVASSSGYLFANGGNGAYTSYNVTWPIVMSSTAASITIPAMIVDGAQMSQVSLTQLDNSADSSNTYGLITVGDNTRGDATLTVDGTSYAISNVYIESCKYTSTGSISISQLQIYFGENGEYVVDLSFTGTCDLN